eukprot:TRINITY_DN4720_c0_g4_i3.p1 TRINITY_DN4720_c0_g4~~TRINITY_DN4720_c0_g4_i3.p1  ORF type:complete len:254 (+),score=45.68 TRINITY_DN4720_c0_g4_i3:53-814(+)
MSLAELDRTGLANTDTYAYREIKERLPHLQDSWRSTESRIAAAVEIERQLTNCHTVRTRTDTHTESTTEHLSEHNHCDLVYSVWCREQELNRTPNTRVVSTWIEDKTPAVAHFFTLGISAITSNYRADITYEVTTTTETVVAHAYLSTFRSSIATTLSTLRTLLAEEERAEEQRRAELQRRRAEEQRRAEASRHAEEQKRIAAQKLAEEQKRIAEEADAQYTAVLDAIKAKKAAKAQERVTDAIATRVHAGGL